MGFLGMKRSSECYAETIYTLLGGKKMVQKLLIILTLPFFAFYWLCQCWAKQKIYTLSRKRSGCPVNLPGDF